MKGWFVVSIHDVAPATFPDAWRWTTDLDDRGIPCTLLVVPGPWRPPTFQPASELAAWLRQRARQGDEIAQHGWEHRAAPGGPVWRRATGWVAARGCAELWSIERATARRSLAEGRERLLLAGLAPVGITPPGYLACPEAVAAMRDVGFHYTTCHRHVHDLLHDRRLDAPALGHRPGGVGERAGRAVVVHGVRRRARRGAPVRIALHPADLHRPHLRSATLRAIDDALDAGLTATTYDRLVA